MTLQSMTRRLDRLGDGPAIGAWEALEAARQSVKAWHAAGNTAPMPFEPLEPLPTNPSRAHRELRAKIEAGRARVLANRKAER
jgi:hypothetical protein